MLNEAAIQKLSELPPGAAGETAVHLPGWGLYVDLEQNDTLGCRMRDLRLIRGLGESTLNADQVGAWATQVAEKATGLMEPLGVVEVDRSRPEALLRSRKPVRKGPEAVRYYEVRLAGDGSCVLKRFEAYPAKNAREAIPFTLTHEGMAKFVDDVGSNLG